MNAMAKDTGGQGMRRGRNGASDSLGANSEIGRKLKQYYDDLIAEDVPDRFMDLLAQLEKAENTQKKG